MLIVTSILAITGVVLRDIADGCTYIVDRPGSLDEEVTRPPRVGLVKIPSTYTFKSGDVVNITALVYTYGEYYNIIFIFH